MADMETASGRANLSGFIYDLLAEAIRHGEYQPGELLKIRSIADKFGCSPTPVRDALVRLSGQKAIEISSSTRSARIPRASQGRIENIYEVRVALEGLATALAAMKASDSEIGELRLTHESMRSAPREDARTILRLNADFHFKIYRASRNDVLVGMIDDLWLLSGPLINFALNALRGAASNHHDDIVRALEDRDPVRSKLALQRDLQSTARELNACVSNTRTAAPDVILAWPEVV